MGKQRRVMDASLDVEYRGTSPKSHDALTAGQRADLSKEVESMTINDRVASIDATFLPSVHRMVNDAYSIIDTELRGLHRTASGRGGLDKVQTGQFERYVAALVKLVNIDKMVSDGSEVDAMGDEELKKKVIETLNKGGKGGR